MLFCNQASAQRSVITLLLVLSGTFASLRASEYCCDFCRFCDPCDQPCGIVWIADCSCGQVTSSADDCGTTRDEQTVQDNCCAVNSEELAPEPSPKTVELFPDGNSAEEESDTLAGDHEAELPGPRSTYRVEGPTSEPEPAVQVPTPAVESTTEPSPPGVAVPSGEQQNFDDIFSEPKPGPAENSPISPAPLDEQPERSPVGERYSVPSEPLVPPTTSDATDPNSKPTDAVELEEDSVESLFEEPSAVLPSGASSFPLESGPRGEAAENTEFIADPQKDAVEDRFLDTLMESKTEDTNAEESLRNPVQDSADPQLENSPPSDSLIRPEPGDENQEEPEGDSLLDDLLSDSTSRATNVVFSPTRGSQFRLWHDRSGLQSCSARVLRFTAEGLILERADGVHVRLAFRKMSDLDLAHIEHEVRQAHSEMARRRAAAQLAGSWTP